MDSKFLTVSFKEVTSTSKSFFIILSVCSFVDCPEIIPLSSDVSLEGGLRGWIVLSRGHARNIVEYVGYRSGRERASASMFSSPGMCLGRKFAGKIELKL